MTNYDRLAKKIAKILAREEERRAIEARKEIRKTVNNISLKK